MAVVETTLPKSRGERIIDQVHTELDDDSVVHYVGRRFLAAHKQQRAVVWVPVSSPIEPATRAGGRTIDGQRRSDVFTRIESFEAHIYAENNETVDLLFDALLGACKRTVHTSMNVGRYSWASEEQDGTNWTLRQPKIVCQIAFQMPVAREQLKLHEITLQDHTCEYVDSL